MTDLTASIDKEFEHALKMESLAVLETNKDVNTDWYGMHLARWARKYTLTQLDREDGYAEILRCPACNYQTMSVEASIQWEKHIDEFLTPITKERDEARAEVARLRERVKKIEYEIEVAERGLLAKGLGNAALTAARLIARETLESKNGK